MVAAGPVAGRPAWVWLGVVLVVLVVVNLLNGVWWRSGYLVTCVAGAAALLATGRLVGMSWADLGLGRAALPRGLVWAGAVIALVGAAYVVAAAVPVARSAAAPGPASGGAITRNLLEITLGTVPLEEVAFRGVLWGLLNAQSGALVATVVSSLLFGIWHVVPSFTDTGVRRPGWLTALPAGTALWTLGTVLITGVAGVLFAELRRRSGSLLAPMGLHWAVNAVGVVFRAALR